MLALSVWSFVLLQSLTVPVLTTIQAELDTDQQTVTWVLTAYLLSASICTPLLGRVGDVVGKTRMLVLCLVLLSVGSLMAALAPSVGWMIAPGSSRAPAAACCPCRSASSATSSATKMNGALSVLASLTAVGFGVGIVIAGPIVDGLGYHWLFLLPMFATIVAAVATRSSSCPSPRSGRPARLPVCPPCCWRCFLRRPAARTELGQRVRLVLRARPRAVRAGRPWPAGPGSAPSCGCPVPMIDMHLMRRRGVWTANVVAGAHGLRDLRGVRLRARSCSRPRPRPATASAPRITESGYLLLPSAAASFVVGFTTARLISWMGARVVIGTGLVARGGLVPRRSRSSTTTTWQLYAATTVQGVGSGLVFSSLAGVVIASVPAEQTGVASGMNANIRTIGGSLGTAVMAGIVTAHVGAVGLPGRARATPSASRSWAS